MHPHPTSSLLFALALSGCISTSELPDLDEDGARSDVDCDDHDPERRPGAPEVCNGLDDDCDSLVDEDATDALTWFRDRDWDGVGNSDEPLLACEAPAGWVSVGGDCDDLCPTCGPGWPEVCDGRDNDCDGEGDEDGAEGSTPWYSDEDGDDYGDPLTERWLCGELPGMVQNDADCDDTDEEVHPGAVDECGDELDGDCDGELLDCTFDLNGADGEVGSADAGDALGRVVFGPGDVDGDGFTDAMIAAPAHSELDASAGVVYLLPGPLVGTLDPEADLATIHGSEPYDQLGGSLGRLGLMDPGSDSWLLAGAPTLSRDVAGGGAAYVFSEPMGTVDADTGAAAVVLGSHEGGALGSALSGAGDLDGDGIADLALGAPGVDTGVYVDSGLVRVFLGPLTGTLLGEDADESWYGATEGASLGGAVRIVGDTDGDGHGDLLMGAWGAEEATGEVWLAGWEGGGDRGLLDVRAAVSGVAAGDQLGRSVSTAGDVDGDGLTDVAMGAWLADTEEHVDTGTAYVFFGGLAGEHSAADAEILLASEGSGAYLGWDLAYGGDVDGSGLGDLLLAGFNGPEKAEGTGLVTLAFDPEPGTHIVEDHAPTLVGGDSAMAAGVSVSGLGDTDGDGIDDIIIGSQSVLADESRASVVLGREQW